MPSSRLVDRVCVVNGAASEIGQAVAERFASEGAVVVGVDQAGHSVGDYATQADLADEPQVEAMYEQVVRSFGRLDVIYNNMGMMDPADHSALDTSLQTWRQVQDAGQRAVFERNPGALDKRLVHWPVGRATEVGWLAVAGW
jgi:NAD(P)-dependent dehydrogenase (short-subunit alcohol dehydrogenase family)